MRLAEGTVMDELALDELDQNGWVLMSEYGVIPTAWVR